MESIRWFAVTAVLAFLAGTPAYGQVVGSSGSLADQFFRLDRNGDGRIDEVERASMQPPKQEPPLALSALPLICESQIDGGGGGGSSSNRRESDVQAERAAMQKRQDLKPAVAVDPAEPEIGEVRQGEPHDATVEGYPGPEETEVEPQAVPRRTGLNKAVQYRLLQNARQSQPRPVQHRQAAVFGATQGLVKREPARYRPVAPISCCVPSRGAYQLQFYYARRN